jgi:hypothetical protein
MPSATPVKSTPAEAALKRGRRRHRLNTAGCGH